MIVKEQLQIKGRDFVKTYSSDGFMIERDGELYSEALDPAEFAREYTQTDIPIEGVSI